MTELKPELKAQIEKEAEEYKQMPHYKDGSALSVSPQIYLKRGYVAGANPYALKLQQAEEMMEKMAKALEKIAKINGEDNYSGILATETVTEYNNYKQTKDASQRKED